MSPPALSHADPTASDDRLATEAAAHLARHPGLQVIAELLTRLREVGFPWWTPEHLRSAYPAAERMRWLVRRPDIRQRITTQLTGLAPRAARNKTPEFQASLIDSVLDEGDITHDVFEQAFEPVDIAVYGPASEIWRLFRKRMPWDDDATVHQDLVGWLVGALLADKSFLDGVPRTPVLSALQVRTAIDGRVWHSRIPLHVRVAIDDARFAHQRERPTEAYGVERDLQIATPALIAASIPLKDLGGVLDVAGLALGFEDHQPASRSYGREHSARPPAPAVDTAEDVPKPEPIAKGAGPVPNLADLLESSAPDIEVHAESDGAPEGGSTARFDFASPDTYQPSSDSSGGSDIAGSSGGSGSADGLPDELEHTNPWAVVSVSGGSESGKPPKE